MKLVLALIFFSLTSISAHAQISAPSTWINTRGSELRILFLDASSGRFKGHYVNNAPGYGCQGIPYDVEGEVRSGQVVFYVNWNSNPLQDCRSITVWRGAVTGATMNTTWRLAYVNSWNLVMNRGSDQFRRR